ncbi:MAG: hypothetical protein U1F56_25550 [Rubrivivax sp.]
MTLFALLLSACGGGGDRPAPPAPPGAPAAAAAPTIATTQLLDWAQQQFADLFPPGPGNQSIVDRGVSYTYRFYPGTGNYLGVGDADGVVYALGPLNGNVLTPYGARDDFACEVLGSCTRFTPDADGNLGAGGLRSTDATVRAGTNVVFDGLGPLDTVIEVASGALDSAALCTAPALPAGAARVVALDTPLPATPQQANAFWGPPRSYPAGVYAMSVSADDCGFVERSSACVSPNEVTLRQVARADGTVDRLCMPTPSLMNPANPTRPLHDPPRPNPACNPGAILDSTWADPGVQGVFVRLSWKELQPDGPGRYDWTMIDRALAQAVRHGKQVTLGLRTGGNSIPGWVFTSGHAQLGPALLLRLRDWGTGPDGQPDGNCGIETLHASPSDAAFKALFLQALSDLAAHVREDARRFAMVAGVKVTGLGQHTLENRLPKRCNIALRDPSRGDTGTQGRIVSMDSRSLAAPIFESKYLDPANPATGRIRDVSLCVCNPQLLAAAGYKPSTVAAFYDEVEATLRAGFGHKQMIFMNISDGFPRVGEAGRFEGDHLVGRITSRRTDPAGQTLYTYDDPWPAPAGPADIPDANDITRLLIEAGRRGDFAPGFTGAGRQFGVENAALSLPGFVSQPGRAAPCSQQLPVAAQGVFAGGAAFPIAASAVVDNTGLGCPNWMATKEGVAFDKVTGFQVTNDMGGAADIDAALWNLTLNSNGLFFEFYEQDAWLSRKQAALHAGGVLDPAPPLRNDSATPNHALAAARTLADWNTLLRARATAFSADARHANAYQAEPLPASFTVPVVSARGSSRWVFNARACRAWAERGVPVRLNRIDIAD